MSRYSGLYPLVALLIISLFAGVLPKSVIAISGVILCLLLTLNDNLYLAMPIMIFYYYCLPFGVLFGISVYRWYTFIYIFYTIYKRFKKTGKIIGVIKYNKIIPILIYYFFCVFAIAFSDLRRGIFAFLDVIVILIFIEDELSDNNRLKKFFAVWAVTSIFSYFTGMMLNNTENYLELINNSYLSITRNNATFEDPNYMGFFYTITAFSVIILKPFKKIPNIILVVTIYVMLFSSLSMSAIIINVIIWIIYFLLSKNKKIWKFLIALAICALLVILYNQALQNGDPSRIFVQLALRIHEKINSLFAGNTVAFTTNRSSLAGAHLELFLQQPLWRKLIGLNPSIPLLKNEMFTNVAHNEYIDWLHNIGIIGTVLMLIYLVLSVHRTYKNYKEEQTKINFFVLMLKFIWVLYSFTLTVFMDPRFMISFLI